MCFTFQEGVNLVFVLGGDRLDGYVFPFPGEMLEKNNMCWLAAIVWVMLRRIEDLETQIQSLRRSGAGDTASNVTDDLSRHSDKVFDAAADEAGIWAGATRIRGCRILGKSDLHTIAGLTVECVGTVLGAVVAKLSF